MKRRTKPIMSLSRKDFAAALVGLGEHGTQLDGGRIYLPVKTREALARFLGVPWIISFWSVSCLRAMPAPSPQAIRKAVSDSSRRSVEKDHKTDWAQL